MERSASGGEGGVIALAVGSLAQCSSYGLISSSLEGGSGGGTFVLFVIRLPGCLLLTRLPVNKSELQVWAALAQEACSSCQITIISFHF